MLFLSACVLAEVSIDDRGCPCVEGWECRDGVCIAAATSSVGDGGPSDAGATVDGACTKEIQFDPENCGVCGRSCGGAACKDGLCNRVELARDISSPTTLSLSPRWLSFTAFEGIYPGGMISRCALAGCGASISSHRITAKAPISLASTADHVFWAEGNGDIYRFFHERSLDGSFGNQFVTSDLATVGAIALAGTRLYFAESAPSGSIRACDPQDLTTCADGGSALVASNQVNLRSLVVDGKAERLFWITDERGGSIVSCAATDACPAPAIVVSNQPDARALAVDATHVYWMSATTSGSLMRAPKAGLGAGESPQVLAADLAMPSAIAVDGEYVYFTTLGAGAATDAATADGTLTRIPRAGGALLTLARGLERPWAIAVDGTSVYWTNRSTMFRRGSIESVAK